MAVSVNQVKQTVEAININVRHYLVIFALFSTLFLFGVSRETGCVGSQTVKTSHTEPPCGDFYYMETQEIWKDVVGYEGLYQVSDLGRVKSLARSDDYVDKNGLNVIRPRKEKYLSLIPERKGYIFVSLNKPLNQKKLLSIHRLVALTFIPNPENKPQVNHKNGNTRDNRLVNLEWASGSENQRHSIDVLGKTFKRGSDSPFAKKVYQYTKNYEFVREWDCIKDVANIGIHVSTVSEVCSLRGRKKTAGGFIWRYNKINTDAC